jgi:hypothetical protein
MPRDRAGCESGAVDDAARTGRLADHRPDGRGCANLPFVDGRGRVRRGAVGLLVLTGCSFDASGSGAASESTGGEETTESTTSGRGTTESVEPATSNGTTEAPDTSGSSEETSEPVEDGAAILQFMDPQVQGNFGAVDLGEESKRILTLTNVGDVTATQLAWDGVALPFDFTGGPYPGEQGDCGGALEGGESCTLDLVFTPQAPGPTLGEVAIHYVDGGTPRTVSRNLIGYGVGATDNLLHNGDAEECTEQGESPPGWTKHAGSGWQCGTPHGVAPYEGQWLLYAGNEGGSGTFQLRQDVDVSAYVGYDFYFIGWARSASSGDDDYRIELGFMDEHSEEIDTWSTGWQSGSSWTPYEFESSVPLATQSISVRLSCTKGSSGSWCDAYFDALELRAVYDAPG